MCRPARIMFDSHEIACDQPAIETHERTHRAIFKPVWLRTMVRVSLTAEDTRPPENTNVLTLIDYASTSGALGPTRCTRAEPLGTESGPN
jgi:hypothetical protein